MSCIYFNGRSNVNDSADYLDSKKFEIDSTSLKLKIEDSINLVGTKGVSCEGNYCFALWNVDSMNNTDILLQGCWDHPDRPDCEEEECVARIPLNRPSMRNSTRFCCCRGDHCNKYMSDNIDASLSYSNQYLNIIGEKEKIMAAPIWLIILTIGIVSALLLSTVAAFIFFNCKKRSKKIKQIEKEFFAEKEACSLIDIGFFEDWQLISHGRYGNVHKAKYLNNYFAVKSFFANHEDYYKNELWVYSQTCLRHPNIVPFLGHFNAPGIHCGLVLKYAEGGSLVALLKKESISWDVMCVFACDIAAAINCLHSEYSHNVELKRMFVHRDINSRNVLVTSSMRAQLCDFGFAAEVGLPHSNQLHIQTPILPTHSNVGTIRYMAPEILEGCVNLGDNRLSLKQVDVYALALVLWEMTTRCHHLNSEVGEFLLAYEAELGEHPGREELYNLVAVAKVRPAFRTNLQQQGFKLLRQTIEECWDDDAEARLSSTTILHRLHQLNNRQPITMATTTIIQQQQPITINNQVDEGAEDCLSSASSRSPVSDNSVTMETVATDATRTGSDRQIGATKSDGNSSGIGGLSGESTLSFDCPPTVNTGHYLQHISPPNFNDRQYNDYYMNNETNEYLNPSLGIDLPFLISTDKTRKYKKDKKLNTSFFSKMKRWLRK